MKFYSELYHESTQYFPKKVGDPISLHWEKVSLPQVTSEPGKRYPVAESKKPVHDAVSADSLDSVGCYAVIRDGDMPKGVYFFDRRSAEFVPVAGPQVLETIVEAFPDKEIVKEAPVLYLFTSRLSRPAWRFKEAAYRQVVMDVGAACADAILFAKSQGKKVFPLGGFVDDEIAVALKLDVTEMPLAAVAIFPETSMLAFNSEDDGLGEFAYSNRSEIPVTETVGGEGSRYPARFMVQNRGECITDLGRCVKVRRVVARGLPGDEFPLTTAKFPLDYYMHEMWFLRPRQNSPMAFKPSSSDLDDFSSMLRWLEVGPFNAFGAGLLKVWIVAFDVMFVFPGVYRYIPTKKSIYMQAGAVNAKKFDKCFAVPEQAQGSSFAVIMTADLNEACNILGERAYRYLNLNAGFLTQSLDMSARLLNRTARAEHFFYHDELKKICSLPEQESILATVLVGKTR